MPSGRDVSASIGDIIGPVIYMVTLLEGRGRLLSLPKHISTAALAPPVKTGLYGGGGCLLMGSVCGRFGQGCARTHTPPLSTAPPCLMPPLPCPAGLLNLLGTDHLLRPLSGTFVLKAPGPWFCCPHWQSSPEKQNQQIDGLVDR